MVFQLADPRRNILMGNKDENEIREIFYKHWDKMKNQIQEKIDEITKWRSRNILRIEQYAKDQMLRLEQDCTRQRHILDKSRRDHLEIARAYSQKKADEPFKQLCNACNKLQFQIAQLDYVQYQTKYPTVLTVKDLKRERKVNGAETQINGCDDNRDQSTLDDASIGEQSDGYSFRSCPQSQRSSNSMK